MLIKKAFLFVLPILFLGTKIANAAGLVPDCGETGSCQLNDFLQTAISASNWLFSIVGSIILLFFIYGGFLFIFSAGSSSQIEKGKNILVGSVIGLLIMFASYIIIQFTMSALGFSGSWQTSSWFN